MSRAKESKASKVLPRRELLEPGATQPVRETHRAGAIKRHMGKVAALGCAVCRAMGLGATPAQCHHIREGQGASQRAPDMLVIPLCPEHHQGDSGIHKLGASEFKRRYRLTELDILADTLELIA